MYSGRLIVVVVFDIEFISMNCTQWIMSFLICCDDFKVTMSSVQIQILIHGLLYLFFSLRSKLILVRDSCEIF